MPIPLGCHHIQGEAVQTSTALGESLSYAMLVCCTGVFVAFIAVVLYTVRQRTLGIVAVQR